LRLSAPVASDSMHSGSAEHQDARSIALSSVWARRPGAPWATTPPRLPAESLVAEEGCPVRETFVVPGANETTPLVAASRCGVAEGFPWPRAEGRKTSFTHGSHDCPPLWEAEA
jgi:hypothetical protein